MKTLSLLLFMAPFLAAQPCQLTDLPSDSNVDGALAATDCAVKDFVRAETSVTRADGWKLVVKESRVFRFRMISTELDPYLWLLSDRGAVIARDNDGGGGKDAEFSVQLSPGAYTLLASLNGTGSGAYRVEVSNTAPRKCKIEPLAEGAEIEGDLVDTDCRNLDLTPLTPDPILVDVYRMEFARPVVLTVSMESTALDALIAIRSATNETITTNNNGGGGTNAKLVLSLDAGTYTIRATAAKAGRGVYRLRTAVEDRRSCTPVNLTLNEVFRGELSRSDCRYLDVVTEASIVNGVDQYRFEVKDRSLATINLRSTVLDTVLILLDSRGALIDLNDDVDRSTSDSRLITSLAPGVYTILATDYYGETGPYEVSVTTAALKTCTAVRLEAPGNAAGAVQTGGCRVLDVITPSSDGSAASTIDLTVTKRSIVTLKATGTGFAPKVEVRSRSTGARLAIGELANELTALMYPGTYTVLVTSRDTGGQGEFTLTSTVREPVACTVQPLLSGTPATGVLSETDCLHRDIVGFTTLESRADIWSLVLESGATLNLELSSETFAPVLMILDENYVPVGLFLPSTGQSRIRDQWRARAGTYYFVIAPFDGGTGEYRLGVSPASSGAEK